MNAERDIQSATTTNRHLAEERNQIELKVDGEVNNEEEAKYGATDRRNTRHASNQDGGIFGSEAGKSGANSSAAAAKSKKNITAPAGKFKTFKKEVSKTAIPDMTEAFKKDF